MKKQIVVVASLCVLVTALAASFPSHAQKTASQPTQVEAGNGAPPLANPLKVALLKWYKANTVPTEFPVGQGPEGLAFDGANIWSANQNDGTVSKVRASDGAELSKVTVGGAGVVFGVGRGG